MPLPLSPSLASTPSRDSRVLVPAPGGLGISSSAGATPAPSANKRASQSLSACFADHKRRSAASAALRRSAFLELSAEVQYDSLGSDSGSDSSSDDSIVSVPAKDGKKQAGHRSKQFSLDDYVLAYDSVAAEEKQKRQSKRISKHHSVAIPPETGQFLVSHGCKDTGNGFPSDTRFTKNKGVGRKVCYALGAVLFCTVVSLGIWASSQNSTYSEQSSASAQNDTGIFSTAISPSSQAAETTANLAVPANGAAYVSAAETESTTTITTTIEPAGGSFDIRFTYFGTGSYTDESNFMCGKAGYNMPSDPTDIIAISQTLALKLFSSYMTSSQISNFNQIASPMCLSQVVISTGGTTFTKTIYDVCDDTNGCASNDIDFWAPASVEAVCSGESACSETVWLQGIWYG
ncbi:hypothetical protein HDU83_000907 [Entophlyctis luteolus]|nr:hypothetical protein HDU83_000907 [Entophlyctis luteolus]